MANSRRGGGDKDFYITSLLFLDFSTMSSTLIHRSCFFVQPRGETLMGELNEMKEERRIEQQKISFDERNPLLD